MKPITHGLAFNVHFKDTLLQDLGDAHRLKLRVAVPRNHHMVFKKILQILRTLLNQLCHIRLPVSFICFRHHDDVLVRLNRPAHFHLTEFALRHSGSQKQQKVLGIAHSMAHPVDCWVLFNVQPKGGRGYPITQGHPKVQDGILCIGLFVAQEKVPGAL